MGKKLKINFEAVAVFLFELFWKEKFANLQPVTLSSLESVWRRQRRGSPAKWRVQEVRTPC